MVGRLKKERTFQDLVKRVSLDKAGCSGFTCLVAVDDGLDDVEEFVVAVVLVVLILFLERRGLELEGGTEEVVAERALLEILEEVEE